ncbi:MAG: hypothetical protein ACRDXD_04970 [Acidimicrobiia bacterium]
MSETSLLVAGALLVTVPSIEFGGMALLAFIRRRDPGYVDNPVRKALFRAGHAHAGVLVILALVVLLYVDHARLPEALRTLVRTSVALAPILVSAGFFFSVASRRAERPNRFLGLVYLGALFLAMGTVTLGVGLLR